MGNNRFKMVVIAMFLATISMAFMSCKKSYVLPKDVLPNELKKEVEKYMPIYEGNTPPDLNNCWFVSSPNNQVHSTMNPEEDGSQSYDRYIGMYNNAFYWKQFQDSIYVDDKWVYDTVVILHTVNQTVIGSGDNFSLYFTREGKAGSYKIKQVVIYSGTLERNVGIRNYKCAYIYTENTGSPDFPPTNSYEVFGDGDGLAEVNNWVEGKSSELLKCLDCRNIIEPAFSYRK